MSDQPEITKEDREKVIEYVKAGAIPFAPTLMKRLGITPEECISPKAMFPVYRHYKYQSAPIADHDAAKETVDKVPQITELYQRREMIYVNKFVDMAVKQGLDYNFVINECTTNPKFMDIYTRILKDLHSFLEPEFTIQDFQFLYDALAKQEGGEGNV